jgi:tetratricopeptide (TPR) repeat protein
MEEPEAGEAVDAAAISAAAALAVGAKRSRSRASAGRDAQLDAFLEKQSRLTDLQTEHLHEQRELQLEHLKVRRWKDRLSLMIQGLAFAAGAAIVVAIALMAWTAHQDHSLVIESFATPPDLAQRGLSGEALAGDMMDKVGAIKAEIDRNSISRSSTVKAEHDNDIKVEIPETGLSITGAWRLLRDGMGGERKIAGDLREAPDGRLVLTARVEGEPAIVATGPPADLDKLEQQVAEKIYAASDHTGGGYVIYLGSTGRELEALAEAESLARRDPTKLALLATVEQAIDPEQAWLHAGMAERADPNSPYPYFERLRAALNRGDPEAALAAAAKLRARMIHTRSSGLSGSGGAHLRALAESTLDLLHGDYAHDPWRLAPTNGASTSMQPATDPAALHDVDRARDALTDLTALRTADSPPQARGRWAVDAAAGDWPAALRDATALMALDDQAQARDPVAAGKAGLAYMAGANDAPLLAEAEAMTGDLAGARATIGGTPLAYDAVRARGRIATIGRDGAGADRWFALAVRLAPSPPFAELDWARSLLARGDADAAIARLAVAHAKGPNFADPEELWGEALMAKHDFAGAAGWFEAADRIAPRWGRNHLCWGEALMLSGRYREARAQFEAADGTYLGRPERAALKILLDRTARGPLHG